MQGLLRGGAGYARRREADALVDRLDTGIAGGDRDLLGTVAVAVQAGHADQHLEAAGGFVALGDYYSKGLWDPIYPCRRN